MVEDEVSGLRVGIFIGHLEEQTQRRTIFIEVGYSNLGINRAAIGPIVAVLAAGGVVLVVGIVVLGQTVAERSTTIVVISGGTIVKIEAYRFGTEYAVTCCIEGIYGNVERIHAYTLLEAHGHAIGSGWN